MHASALDSYPMKTFVTPGQIVVASTPKQRLCF